MSNETSLTDWIVRQEESFSVRKKCGFARTDIVRKP